MSLELLATYIMDPCASLHSHSLKAPISTSPTRSHGEQVDMSVTSFEAQTLTIFPSTETEAFISTYPRFVFQKAYRI